MNDKAEWENWVNFILGIWLFVSPWIFMSNLDVVSIAANLNFWTVGFLIALSAGFALRDLKPWEEWTNLALGIWVGVSPWIFGYTQQTNLVWNSVLVGLGIAVLSGIALPTAQKLQKQKS